MNERIARLELFLERPLAVASALAKGMSGVYGGSYVEACLVACTAISSVASVVWPGTGADRARFVEAWTQFASPDVRLAISRPLLIQYLLEKGQHDQALALGGTRTDLSQRPLSDRLVLMGRDVDAADGTLTPSIPEGLRRKHSYAALLYGEIRCSLVHEHELGRLASRTSMSTGERGVSYAKGQTAKAVKHADGTYSWSFVDGFRIHFDAHWLIEQARTIAKNADTALAGGSLSRPQPWWIGDAPRKRCKKGAG